MILYPTQAAAQLAGGVICNKSIYLTYEPCIAPSYNRNNSLAGYKIIQPGDIYLPRICNGDGTINAMFSTSWNPSTQGIATREPQCMGYCLSEPGNCGVLESWCDTHPEDVLCAQYPGLPDEVMSKVISIPNHLSYKTAQDWCLNNVGAPCDEATIKFCTDNPTNTFCARYPYLPSEIMRLTIADESNLQYPAAQEWCKMNPGKCDVSASRYCLNDTLSGSGATKDVFCSCLNSPVTRYNPLCVDRTCLAGTNGENAAGIPGSVGGYVNNNMTILPCPDIVDCTTQIALEAAGRITTGNVTLSQNCGNTTVDPPPVDPPPVDPPPVDPPPVNSNGLSPIMIFILLFIVLIVFGFIYSKFNSKNDKKYVV
jgi:hypothetical protein